MEQFKSAIVYGKSVKHQPQRVGLAHELDDEDVGTLIQAVPFLRQAWLRAPEHTVADGDTGRATWKGSTCVLLRASSVPSSSCST